MKHEILWTPNDDYKNHSKMADFLSRIFHKYNLPDQEYYTIHEWSVKHIPEFWAEIWDYCEIKYSRIYDQVLDNPDKMPGARWFTGARLNFAENLLRRRDGHTALIFWGEDVVRRQITYADLYEQVTRVAASFKKLGLKKGDRIAAFMPNMPETVIAMLAATSIGAIWSSTSPDFGSHGVLDRFSQISPKIIIATDGYYYKGEKFDSQEKLKFILIELPTIEHVVMVSYTGLLNISDIPKALSWEEVTQPTALKLIFEQLPFDHPLYIMFSSGTTGLPKSIVHSAGGTLLQHLKELILHTNLQSDQIIFYYTTCGWMMWNWFVSSLATGATLVPHDGNPFYPDPGVLIRMADELNLNVFGTSAKYIASLEEAGVKPREISDFPVLKVIASTGSPLTNASFRYVFRDWKKDVQLSSIAGGTDIISCFMLGNPVLPVYLGEIQCKGLGMDVDCFDENGNPLIEEQGEMVCKSVFPSMPVYFWNDPDGEKYTRSYFDVYPGVWRHGDFITISKHGGITIYGRSDASLNPQGVRIGG
ncbi:MAG: acetoacetate--CoA ligase, partial [Bacteroidetes bacterium]|nr:acetoacetate--CoA ligase [Bacteroidota bacterium]